MRYAHVLCSCALCVRGPSPLEREREREREREKGARDKGNHVETGCGQNY